MEFINRYLINKMGWIDYYSNYNLFSDFIYKYKYTLFEEDDKVKYFYKKSKEHKIYFIKQISDILYNFIEVDMSKGKPKFKQSKFSNNIELFKLIIENEAYKDSYKRHFRINKIIKK